MEILMQEKYETMETLSLEMGAQVNVLLKLDTLAPDMGLEHVFKLVGVVLLDQEKNEMTEI
jgi:chaperonin cofactor prefoldin